MSSKQMDFGNEAVRLRPGVQVQECSVAGCDELGAEFLPQRMQVPPILWWKPHAQMLARMIAERDYRDFVSALREVGVTKPPKLVTAEVVGDKRKCCVPGCKEDFYCGMIFEPYKNPGRAWVCASHAFAANEALSRLNGPRLLHELQRKPRSLDPHRRKRARAIRSAGAMHQGKPNYIEAVCRDLQRERISMPQRWLQEWEAAGFRVESSNWFDALRGRIAKKRIQKFISKACQAKPRIIPRP